MTATPTNIHSYVGVSWTNWSNNVEIGLNCAWRLTNLYILVMLIVNPAQLKHNKNNTNTMRESNNTGVVQLLARISLETLW